MANSAEVPSGSVSGETVGEGNSFKLSEISAGSAGILHSTGVLLTPSDFAELKEKIATFSSFDELAANFSSRVLTRGTMVIKTVSADKAEDERAAVVTECLSCSNVPTSTLTTDMLEEAEEAVSEHKGGEFYRRRRPTAEEIRSVEGALEKVRAELAARHDSFSVAHAMQINVKSLTGEIVAKSGVEMVEFLGPGCCKDEQNCPVCERRRKDEQECPACEKIILLALQPVVCRFQHELLRIILDNIGRPDLVNQIRVLDAQPQHTGRGPHLMLRIPLGRAKGVTFDIREYHFQRGLEFGEDQYDQLDVDLWLNIRSADFCYGWTQDIQCGRAAPNTPDFWGETHWGDFRDSVSVCPDDPAAMLCALHHSRFRHLLTDRAVFASAAECRTAVKTIKDLQTAFGAGNVEEAAQAAAERCPEYHKTHSILRAPYEKLAFVLDMGGESRELERNTSLVETVDWVNSEEYRSYHELAQQEVLHYAVYVSVKADAENEAGQEDRNAAAAGSVGAMDMARSSEPWTRWADREILRRPSVREGPSSFKDPE